MRWYFATETTPLRPTMDDVGSTPGFVLRMQDGTVKGAYTPICVTERLVIYEARDYVNGVAMEIRFYIREDLLDAHPR